MRSRILRTFIFAGVLLLGSKLSLAHHGDAGRYDDDTIDVVGTVVALQLIHPHSSIIFDIFAYFIKVFFSRIRNFNNLIFTITI